MILPSFKTSLLLKADGYQLAQGRAHRHNQLKLLLLSFLSPARQLFLCHRSLIVKANSKDFLKIGVVPSL